MKYISIILLSLFFIGKAIAEDVEVWIVAVTMMYYDEDEQRNKLHFSDLRTKYNDKLYTIAFNNLGDCEAHLVKLANSGKYGELKLGRGNQKEIEDIKRNQLIQCKSIVLKLN